MLDDVRPRAVAPGVELVGAPWPSRRPARNPALDALEALGPAGPLRILAAHGGVDALTPDRRDASLLPLAPIEQAIAQDRIHYAALGDRHSLTCVGATGRIWYAGAPEPTDFDEREPGFALVVELDRDGARAEPHHVGTWRFARAEPAALDGPDDLDALADRLTDFDAKERTALRLELRGSLDLRGAARLEALLDRMRDLFAGLDVRDAELRVAARDGDLEGLALAGFAARAAARLAEEARGDAPDAGGRARRARAAGPARRCAGGRGVKVLRLRLRNYRGIAEREIEFAPSGVTIVSGPNEVGKSSLSEAIELLFDERDDTAKQRVREIQPVDRDEGSEVEVDALLGPFRFTYAKRYHRKSETRLSVRAPRVEQATGREAHERVRALLDAHLDTALWRALRIVQGAPLDAPALAGAVSLAAALDRAAGVGAGGEREESLFERARAAFDRHFTPTGRARRSYVEAQQALAAAQAEVAQLRARLDALERDVDAEAALRARVAELEQRIAAGRAALCALEEELAELAALRAEGERAAARLAAARAQESVAVSLARQRGQLVSAHAGAQAEMESLAEALESEAPAHLAAAAELRHVEERLLEARRAREAAAQVVCRRGATSRCGAANANTPSYASVRNASSASARKRSAGARCWPHRRSTRRASRRSPPRRRRWSAPRRGSRPRVRACRWCPRSISS